MCGIAKPSEMAGQIGLGPSLFLMSTKAMAIFFMCLTIVNLPLLYFYMNGSVVDNMNQSGDFALNFVRFTLGNIG